MTPERLALITAALASPTRDTWRGERALEFEGYVRELVGACAELLAQNARLRGELSYIASMETGRYAPERAAAALAGEKGEPASAEVPVPGWEWVTTREGRCGGRPCIRGTRFDVVHVVNYFRGGATVNYMVENWDYIPYAAFAEIERKWKAGKIPAEWLEETP